VNVKGFCLLYNTSAQRAISGSTLDIVTHNNTPILAGTTVFFGARFIVHDLNLNLSHIVFRQLIK